MKHLRTTKEQIQYQFLTKEFDYIKKRSLQNFLTTEKLNVEKHFHDRSFNMLKSIAKFETENMINLSKTIAQESMEVVHKSLADPALKDDILEGAF